MLAVRSWRTREVWQAWLATSALIMALAEYYFTLYQQVTDTYNLTGHMFKVAAYMMVYRAIFVEGVQQPQRDLNLERSRLRSLVDSTPDIITFSSQHGNLLGSNDAWSKAGPAYQKVLAGAEADLGETDHDPTHVQRWVREGDETKLFDIMRAPYHDGQGHRLGTMTVARDITSAYETAENLNWLTNYDPLTELPNRTLLTDRGRQAVTDMTLEQQPLALVVIDIDDMRAVNETLGQAAGNELLVMVANRIRAAVPPSETVARVGGDEFALLLRETSAETAAELATTILNSFQTAVDLPGAPLQVSLTAGIAVFPEDGPDFDALLKSADAAMYAAKSSPHKKLKFFTEDLHTQAIRRLRVATELRHGIRNGELQVYYQPQVDLLSLQPYALEALVRWQHPQRGLIAPAEFIDIAEQSDLIFEIGRFVMSTALSDLKRLRQQDQRIKRVAINISAAQFHDLTLVQQVTSSLKQAGMPPECLEIEITETVSMVAPDVTRQVVAELRAMGVHVAIDDFGTGYSSLAYLQSFRVDVLKVDRTFVQHIAENQNGYAIMRAILELGRALRYHTVAEGVETLGQLDALVALGCQGCQGFLFSEPLPFDQLRAKLRKVQDGFILSR